MKGYVGDVGYGLAVRAGVAVVLIFGGVVVGDQGFDAFGRRPAKGVTKMKIPESWPIEIKTPR
jgi:hypothetical protein